MALKRSKKVQEMVDKAAKSAFGMTLSEAIEKRICPFCKQKIGPFQDALSEKEYAISGLCQKCQDEIFK